MKDRPERRLWRGMIARCENPKKTCFERYGGRGISVHPRWRHSFEAFLEDVGPRPTPAHSLERIDNDRGYEPGNVTWATIKEQSRNKRTNRRVTFQGKTACLAEWAEVTGLSIGRLHKRLAAGWSVERTLTSGLQPIVFGEANGSSKLTGQQVLEIRRLLRSGASQRHVARLMRISAGCVAHIASNRTWRHLS